MAHSPSAENEVMHLPLENPIDYEWEADNPYYYARFRTHDNVSLGQLRSLELEDGNELYFSIA